MLSIIRRTLGRRSNHDSLTYTKNIARNRLHTAISRDRFDLVAPDLVEPLRLDMLATIRRHLEVGDGFQEFELRRVNHTLELVCNIRVVGAPRWAGFP